MSLLFQKPESARSSFSPLAPARRDAWDELFGEPQPAAGGVRRALARANVQHLARIGTGREDLVVAALAGVAEPGAPLGIAMHLADERVDVDDEAPVAGTSADCPCR